MTVSILAEHDNEGGASQACRRWPGHCWPEPHWLENCTHQLSTPRAGGCDGEQSVHNLPESTNSEANDCQFGRNRPESIDYGAGGGQSSRNRPSRRGTDWSM
jgi:hypothetical protein